MNVIDDYWKHKKLAIYWAKIAIENYKNGLPWQQSAKNSHAALTYALLII